MIPAPGGLAHALPILLGSATVCLAAANLAAIVLAVAGCLILRATRPPLLSAQADALLRSPLLPRISLIAPISGSVAAVRERLDALLRLSYPSLEVIAIDDGCDEDVLRFLADTYRLYKSARALIPAFTGVAVRGIYESDYAARLVVVDRYCAGARCEALNAGVSLARSMLVAPVAEHALPTGEGLAALAAPFFDYPDTPPLACAGITSILRDRPAAGAASATRAAAVIAGCATLAHCRGVLDSIALASLGAPLPPPHAMVLFDREALLAIGGFDYLDGAEAAAAFAQLSRAAARSRSARSALVVPQIVGEYELAGTPDALLRERAARARAPLRVIRQPNTVGAQAKPREPGIPAALTFAGAVIPMIELAGYATLIAGLLLRLVPAQSAALFALSAAGFGVTRSIAAAALTGFSGRLDYAIAGPISLLLWSVAEQIGLRQFGDLLCVSTIARTFYHSRRRHPKDSLPKLQRRRQSSDSPSVVDPITRTA